MHLPNVTNTGASSLLPQNKKAIGPLAEVRPRTENLKGILATANTRPGEVPALYNVNEVLRGYMPTIGRPQKLLYVKSQLFRRR